MAFITVSDAAGRVLFRRRATEAEIADAKQAAEEADEGAEAMMTEIAAERYAALAAGTTISRELEPPPEELGELEQLEEVPAEPEYRTEFPPQAEPSETGLFSDSEMSADTIDPWFGDARFSQEEEIAS
jgi:hypothetical protein